MNQTIPRPTFPQALKLYACTKEEKREQLIEKHLHLIKTVVQRMRVSLPATVDYEELHSLGLTGLVVAVQKYDPAQSSAFASFAMQHIRGAILDGLRQMDWLSRGNRKKAKQLQEVVGELEQRLGRPASEREICAAVNMTEEAYRQLIEEIRPVCFVAIDQESQETEELSLHEVIADGSQQTALEQLERKELQELMAARIQALPPMPRKILAMYYFEHMRFSEIAAAFGVTEGRISQVHTQAVLSLRSYMAQLLRNQVKPTCS